MTKHRSGMAMLDMLLAIGLGLVILLPLASLIRTALLFQSRQEAAFVMEQDGVRLLDLIERAILQVGHTNLIQPQPVAYVALSGLDNAMISGASNALEGNITSGVHGSDVLAVHFSSSSAVGTPDLLNCAGFSVPSTTESGSDRGWSIFYLVPGEYWQRRFALQISWRRSLGFSSAGKRCCGPSVSLWRRYGW